MKTELKEEIEECGLCKYVREQTNLKPPICEFHRGKQEATKDFIKMINEMPCGILSDFQKEQLKQKLKEKNVKTM